MSAKQIYEFAEFRIDPDERQLLRDGKTIPLTPKAFETLLALVENSGHVVRKDDLMKRVWPDSFVEEVNLAKNVSTLRQLLETNGEAYIETVPKLGYRLIVKARAVGEPGPPAQNGPQAAALLPAVAPQQPIATAPVVTGTAAKKRIVVGICLATAALIVLGIVLWRRAPARGGASGKIMLAVLPFENYSPQSEQEYLADGLTEEMITQLGSLDPKRLGVIARTSAMKYKRARVGVDQIGKELDVDYVLEGSIRTEADRVRVTAQLIRVKDQTHLWARSYEHTRGGILTMQQEVANAIANEIQVELTPQYQQRVAALQFADPRAHEAYVRGRFFWNKRTEADLITAINYFEEVLRYEPRYALAYSGLADAYFYRSYAWGSLPPREGMQKAKEAATKALELGPDLAESHTSMALVKFFYDWDWPAAEAEFKRAIELNPNYPTAHHGYAVLLMIAYGRMDDAIAEANRALELDPLSVPLNNIMSLILMHAGRNDETIERAKKLHELNPKMRDPYHYMSVAYEAKGASNEAVESLLKARELEGASAEDMSRLRQAYAKGGIAGFHQADADVIVERAKKQPPHAVLERLALAEAYAQLGNHSAALDILEKICDERSGMALWTKVGYLRFPNFSSDPRFQALLRRIGLPQ